MNMKEEVVLRWLKKAENDLKIRFPEEYIELSIDEARELYETAKEVKEFVVDRFKDKGLRWQNYKWGHSEDV